MTATIEQALEQPRTTPGRARQPHKDIPWRSLSTCIHRRDKDGPTLVSTLTMDTRRYWRRVAGGGASSVYEMQEGVPHDL